MGTGRGSNIFFFLLGQGFAWHLHLKLGVGGSCRGGAG